MHATHSPIAAPNKGLQRRLNVVLVDEELPYPPTSGKRIRSLNLTFRLARRPNLTYLRHRNVDSVIWQRYHETEGRPLKRWYITQQWRKFVEFERWAVRHADLTVAVSAVDAERFQRDFGAPRVDVVDNGVDTDYFRPQSVL